MRTKKRWARIVVPAAAVLMLATGIQGEAKPRYRVTVEKIAPGLTLKKIRDRRGPNRIRVLVVDPSSAFRLDVALGTEELPGHETTSSMAARHGAVAAVNGDYSLLPSAEGSGRPVHTFIEDGELHASPLSWGRNFSIRHDEASPRVGHTRLKTWLTQGSGEVWDISAVNPVAPADDAYTLYTPAGGKLFQPPKDSCAARLVSVDEPGWNVGNDGLSEDFVVDHLVCRERRLRRQGHYVLTAPRDSFSGFEMQTSLFAGEVVGYGWGFKRPSVLDTIGGNPDLVQQERIAVEPCSGSYFCGRNPRTGVGIKPNGKILLVTVDGRMKSSVGMTPNEFADLFVYLGARAALNLDGGGSTTRVVRNNIVNVPSGGYERPVGTSLLVIKGDDPGEIVPGPYVTPSPTPVPTATSTPTPAPTPTVVMDVPGRSWVDGFQAPVEPRCRVLLDPGSTGGMLDALAKGLLGPRRELAPELRRALAVYRGRAVCG